ncbi:MAG: carbohydrate kinase family protein, partial [Bacteroidetes bacterium]|nr:carbohydrate kinase family protein [Bacteroidota bacterium]MBU1421651.1 carbohydrate kinase family protein [Bacteroidota bacterium]MBU2635635.1 carbohydrate kinase family protein [Bacteroidota bacterium]
MKITVIGHICMDVIRHPDGKESQGYGGIYYSLVALANIVDPYTKLFPVFSVGNKDYATLIERLSAYPNIDTDGIFKHDGLTNQVHLFYDEKQTRIECSQSIAPPIPFKKIKSYLETNMILINMVSGFDITLDTLDEIRMHVREDAIPIYMDAHSLSLGINGDGSRYRRPLTDWRRWLFMLHTVQMNEEEAASLSVEKYDELNFVKQVTALNSNNVIITRGANGCTLYHDERKQIQRFDFSGEKIERTVDSTGCGDVFAAAYCAKYIRSKNETISAEFANKVAAYNAECNGSSEIDKLSKFKINEIK